MKRQTPKGLELGPYPERAFTLVAFVLSISSVLISAASVVTKEIPSWLLATKDFSIFLVLLILVLFFFLRYRQVLKDYEVQEVQFQNHLVLIQQLINEQTSFYHQVIRQTRSSFYSEFGAGIYPHRFIYQNTALRDIMEKSLTAVVAVMSNILKNQLKMRDVREKVSISIKAIVTGRIAKSLCSLSATSSNATIDEATYIITLSRDSDTIAFTPEREVRQVAYPLDDNTDFNWILTGNGEDFMGNDLKELAKQKHYRNNNPQWEGYYNATLVVPIAHRETEGSKPLVYGFLTADSRNESNVPLFSREETKPIMAFGADLLALIFLNLEMYDRFASTQNNKTAAD